MSTQVKDDQLNESYIKANGQRPFSEHQSMGGKRLTNLAAPVDDNDAARKIDVISETGQRNQNNITFTNINGDYFGTASSPRTGTLTFDATGAVIGGIAVVYYNNATLDMPEPLLQKGTFAPGELNKIYLERDSQGFITANIINGATTVPGIPSATAPTITVTDPVFDPDAPSATAPTITVTNP
jgi:hypothetical protein